MSSSPTPCGPRGGCVWELGRGVERLGRGHGGRLLLDDNAPAFDYVRFANHRPVRLPGPLDSWGEFRLEVFNGVLPDADDLPEDPRFRSGSEPVARPRLLGMRLDWAVTDWLELGMSRSHRVPAVLSRVRGHRPLRDLAGRRGAWPLPLRLANIALLQGVLLSTSRATLRVEHARTSPSWYRHSQYPQGYTHGGLPLGHPMGGDARGWFLAIDHAWNRSWRGGSTVSHSPRGGPGARVSLGRGSQQGVTLDR